MASRFCFCSDFACAGHNPPQQCRGVRWVHSHLYSNPNFYPCPTYAYPCPTPTCAHALASYPNPDPCSSASRYRRAPSVLPTA
jgi:hypothetical protein